MYARIRILVSNISRPTPTHILNHTVGAVLCIWQTRCFPRNLLSMRVGNEAWRLCACVMQSVSIKALVDVCFTMERGHEVCNACSVCACSGGVACFSIESVWSVGSECLLVRCRWAVLDQAAPNSPLLLLNLWQTCL